MARQQDVRVRRVYEAPSPDDGQRILVDRLWPRGLSKGTAQLDEWLKAVAPSTGLRRWYGHEPRDSPSSAGVTTRSCVSPNGPRRWRS